MSLLNDALRKRRSEDRPLGEPLSPQLMSPCTKSKRRNRWAAVMFGFAFLTAGAAAWWFGSAPETISGSAVAGPAADLPEARANDGLDKPTVLPPEPAVEVKTSSLTQAVYGGIALPERAANIPSDQPMGASVSLPAPLPSSENSAVTPSMQPAGKSASKPRGHDLPRGDKGNAPDPTSPAPAGPPANPDNRRYIENLYQKARQYHRRNRLQEAIALYQEVLKADRKYEKARFNLVAAYLQVEAFTKAYPMAAELYQQEPENQQIILNLAIAQIGCGRAQEALSLLEKAAGQSDAALFEIAFHKAVAYRHLDRMQDALVWYKRAEAMRPDDAGLLFNLAVAYDQQQQYAEAITYYQKSIDNGKGAESLKTTQIRDRIRILQAYHAPEKFGE